jgi:hypothetical protein
VPSRVPSRAPVIPSVRPSDISSVRASVLFRGVARFARRCSLSEPRFKLFWQTVAVAASMLLFSLVRPSANQLAPVDAMQSAGLSSGTIPLHRPVSPGTRSQPTGLSKPSRAELDRSDYPIAKDFTNHLAVHGRDIATVQKSDLTRNQREGLTRRVIID